MKINIRLISILIVLGLLVFVGVFTGREFYASRLLTRSLDNKMHAYAQQKTQDVMQKISAAFQQHAQMVRDVATQLGERQWDKVSLDLFLKSKMEKYTNIDEICIAFKPYVFDKSIRLYAPYYTRTFGQNKLSSAFVKFDYILPTEQAGDHTEWYRDFVDAGEGWTEPYYSTQDQRHIITYSAQFFSPLDKKNSMGVIELDLDLDRVTELVNNLALDKRCYGFLVSLKGEFVSYPNKNYLINDATMGDIDKAIDQALLLKNKPKMLKQKNGNVSYESEITGQKSVFYYRAVSGTNLILGMVFDKDEVFLSAAPVLKKSTNRIMLGILLIIILLTILLLFFLKNIKTRIVICLIEVFALAVGLTGREVYSYKGLDRSLNKKMHIYAEEKINSVFQTVSLEFYMYSKIVHDAAKELSERTWDKESLNLFLKSKLEKYKGVSQIFVAYRPYAFDKSTRLYAPYYKRAHDSKKISAALVDFDYTLPTAQAGDHTEWYRDFIDAGEGWTEPYFSTQDQRVLITYSAPFFSPSDKKKSIGVVEIDIDLDYLRDIVNQLAFGKQSYGFVISATKGTFLTFPIESIYRKGATMFDLAKFTKNKTLEDVFAKMVQKKSGEIPYRNFKSGRPAVVYHRLIPKTNFILAFVFIKDEFFSPKASLIKHDEIKIVIGVVISLFLLLLLLGFFFKNTQVFLIVCSALYSIILFSGIGFLWQVQREFRPSYDDGRILVEDQRSISNMFLLNTRSAKNTQPPIKIETGILFDQIAQISNLEFYVSGLLWQKYPLSCDPSIKRDFLMLQSKPTFKKELIYQGKDDKEETCLWKIFGNIGQANLISQAFPLDAQGIDILFAHPALDKNVLLTPAIDSYKMMNPQDLPGISRSVSIVDWIVDKSFFSFKSMLYEADLGMKKSGGVNQKYALCFTIEAKRCLGGFIIMYLLPLLVALLLLFINLCITKPDRIMTNISLTSGTFLGLILTHSAMRRVLMGTTVLYLEYFYIVPYFLIILLLINLILYSQEKQIAFIRYEDNLLTKVLFWPSFLCIMFLITCWIFW